MSRSYDRRTFLRGSALSSAALALAPRTFARDFRVAPAAKPQKVAIVGAGIAGLVAAYELMRSGHEVTVFEARMRPGGRIHTLRDGFADGLYVEAGALDYGDAYTLLQQYIRAFDLPIAEEDSSSKTSAANDIFYLKGRRFVVTPGAEPEWPYELSSEERKLGLPGLWDKYVRPVTERMEDPDSKGWPDSTARQLEGLTLNEFFRKQGAPDAVISVLRMSFLGEDFDHVAALQDLVWQRFFDRNKKWMTLRGGNDLLPKAFAQKLGSRIRYGAPLVKLTQDDKRVRLTISSGGSIQTVECDRAIVAIPFSVLRNVELGDSFSAQKRMVISKLRYDSATHIYVQSSSRFWAEQGLSGFANTDLPIRSIFHLTATQSGPRGILGTEMEGENSRMVTAMKPEKRVQWGLEDVSKVFPEMAENFDGGTSVVWDEEPWSLGAAAYFAPGEMISMFPHVATVEGRVHFAGEHTSPIYVMEGAAQSGVRAAREINDAGLT